MFRLNQRAFDILRTEIEQCSPDNPVGKLQKEIVLKRLQKLRSQAGSPLTAAELRDTLDDLYPNFRESVLQAAARANRPSTARLWQKGVLAGGATIAGMAGIVWILNLPFPMIRIPVSRVAPLVLLPSFMSMDHNYRQAIALVEQSDQLVNQATSAADLQLGSTKVKAAQKHLDALPVWFLGYYPQVYCGWASCSWRFTLDEFQQARKQIARMDARLFQEMNAQTQLNEADQSVNSAKQQYQEAPDAGEKQAAIAQWQQGMDALAQIPPETLAGRMATTRLQAYRRDYQQVTGLSSETTRSSNLLQAAEAFASNAQQASAGDAHSEAEWEQILKQWQQAIDRLEQIDVKDADYGEAQKRLASYGQSLGKARVRLSYERESVAAFEQAQQLTENLLAQADSISRGPAVSQFRKIEVQLSKVKPGTTVYAEAQSYKKFAEAKRKQIEKRW